MNDKVDQVPINQLPIPDKIQMEGTNDSSLDCIIELLRTIDVVKRKMQRGNSQSSSTNSESHENNASTSRREDNERKDHIDDNLEKVENENSSRGDLSMKGTIDMHTLLKRVRAFLLNTMIFNDLCVFNFIQLKDVESSLEEIIAEKEEAEAKVDQLGEENRILKEKLDYFTRSNAANSQSATIDELNKTIEAYKLRVAELEEQSSKG